MHANALKLRRSLGDLLLALALAFFAVEASAADAVAEVNRIRGDVSVTDVQGAVRPLAGGAPIFSRESVATAEDSRVTFRFTDGTRVALGANTIFNVEDYAYSEEPSRNRFGARLTRGIARFVTGLIAKRRPRSVSVSTPVATIGIRGTHFVSEVAEDESATVILLEPEEDPDRKTAIEVANAAGSVTIEDPGYGTEIPDANTAPSPPRRMQTQTVERLIRQVNTARRVRIPRPPVR